MRAMLTYAPSVGLARASRTGSSSLIRWMQFTTTGKKILIPTALDPVAKKILMDNKFEVVQDTEKGLKLVEEHPDAFGLIVRSEKVDKALLEKMNKLKVVVRAGAGYNNIDTKLARRRGVDVMNTPGANANGVAEEVVALALALLRQVVPADASTRAGLWEKKKFMGRELHKKTFGIVGLGAIGQLVVQRLRGFECDILAYDPLVSESRAKELGVEMTSLEGVFSGSDLVTLHIPETADTKHLVSTRLLSLMKPNAVLINCARSGVVDEAALRKHKETNKLLFATDVYPKDEKGEKPVKDVADIMLPHIGANTYEANFNAAERAALQIVDYVEEGVTKYVVNRTIPEGLDANYQKLAFYLSRLGHAFLGLDQHLQFIETSFYGQLKKYGEWLVAPVVMGLREDFDPTFDAQLAVGFLKEHGIALTNREVDNRKGYGESITIDMMSGSGENFKKLSLRGTLAEGSPMISRINDFKGMFFDPRGMSVLVEYKDQPGMLAKITNLIAKDQINIVDIRAPQDAKSGRSLAVIRINKQVSQGCLEEIKKACDTHTAVFINLH